jgi:large subunit ribosomal protein L25
LAAVAGERIRLEVRERAELGSRDSRRLRQDGLVPGVLYGRGKKPHAFVVPERELRQALTGPHGLHAILDVSLDDQKTTHSSVIKDFQRDPLRGRLIHVDLQEVRLDKPIQASVSIELTGESPGVKQGGVLSQLLREVTVEALPLEVPDRLVLDIAGVELGGTLRLSDLAPPEGVTLQGDPESVVLTVALPKRIVEEEVVEAVEAEGVEAEAAEAVEAAPAPEGESPAEPAEE